MPQLEFNIKGQIIRRTDRINVVADSRNYLYAHFTFETEEWTGIKTAIFKYNGEHYEVILTEEESCLVPHEVLEGGGKNFYVSVFCGDLITANTAKVFVNKSGYFDDADAPPTPSVYSQILAELERIREDEDELVDVKEAVEESAQTAIEMAQQTEEDAEAVSADKLIVEGLKDDVIGLKADVTAIKNETLGIKNDTIAVKNDAITAKNEAISAKTDAETASTNASGYADDAAESARIAAQYEPPSLVDGIIHFPYGGGE